MCRCVSESLRICILLLALVLAGCDDGGGNAVTNLTPTGAAAPAVAVPKGSILLKTQVAGSAQVRSQQIVRLTSAVVPGEVTHLRFSGIDASGQFVFGPKVLAKSAEMLIEDVPVTVTLLRIELLTADELVLGALSQPVRVSAGQTTEVPNPNYSFVAFGGNGSSGATGGSGSGTSGTGGSNAGDTAGSGSTSGGGATGSSTSTGTGGGSSGGTGAGGGTTPSPSLLAYGSFQRIDSGRTDSPVDFPIPLQPYGVARVDFGQYVVPYDGDYLVTWNVVTGTAGPCSITVANNRTGSYPGTTVSLTGAAGDSQTAQHIVTATAGDFLSLQRTGTATLGDGFLSIIRIGPNPAPPPTIPPGNVWRTVASNAILNAAATGNGLTVAVGRQGLIRTSSDRTNWTYQQSGSNSELQGISYGNGQFVAVGAGGTILTSSDGTLWTARSSGTPNFLYDVAFGSGRFVAVGVSGTIRVSNDGVNWSDPGSVNNNILQDVVFAGGQFLATGEQGTVLTSPDGLVWNSASQSPPTENLLCVGFNGSTYVTVSASGNVFLSNNGDSWSQVAVATLPATSPSGLAFGDSKLVVVGQNGVICTSPDGTNWTSPSLGVSAIFLDVTFSNSEFLVVGASGTILTSPDGTTWTDRTTGTANFLNSVVFGNARFVAVGSAGTVLSSSDGQNWAQSNSGVGVVLTDVAFGNGLFVAVGDGGTILTSATGTSWSPSSSGTNVFLSGISFAGGQFLAVGDSGTILTSPNGIMWTERIGGTPFVLNDVAFDGQRYVVVGDAAYVAVSTNGGVTWTGQNLPGIFASFSSVVFANGNLRIANGNDILTSSDGVTWTPQPSNQSIFKMLFANGGFVSPTGGIKTSLDGFVWASRFTPTSSISDVAFGAGRYVGVGGEGTIVVSP